MEDLGVLFGSLGVTALLAFSACGSCSGMMDCATSSILYAQIHTVLTYSYISMIMVSTVFFYAFILSIVIVNKLGSAEYSLHQGIVHLAAGTVFGLIGLSSGKRMGLMARNGFEKIAKVPEFYTSFMIALASVEVTLVIGFLCSLLMIYKV